MSFGWILIFNGIVVTILVIYFLWIKVSRPRPTQLNLRKGGRPLQPVGGEKALDSTSEEELNVLFNYNGHLWDAFEVLGIPAGSPQDMVERAYQQAIHSVDPSSQTLIKMAYEAIHQRSNW